MEMIQDELMKQHLKCCYKQLHSLMAMGDHHDLLRQSGAKVCCSRHLKITLVKTNRPLPHSLPFFHGIKEIIFYMYIENCNSYLLILVIYDYHQINYLKHMSVIHG